MTRATQAMDLLSSRLKEAQEQVKQAKKHAQDQLQAQRQQFRQEQRDMEAKLTEKWQAQVENAYEREMSSQDAMQMLEIQLERQNQVVQAVTTQLEEMKDAERRLESEMEQCQRQREQETREEMEVFRTKLEAEIEHWKAVSTEREEEMTKLRLQMETMRQQLVARVAVV
ncbi:unnamed protein product [Peronospora belbahrii]|uniref:Uncharacterized protein n=1 Tax=Peronospora belbahrii TaxID=622444 RepID=A0AAU9KLR3_9STRA|nr:unnamed protein product [Peronospora belbahrii]